MKSYNLIFCALASVFCACSDSEPADNNVPKEFKPLSVPASQSRVSSQTNDFSLTLFDATINNQGDENVLFSPLSANISLSMLCNAVNGSTRAELIDVLGFGDDLESLNAYNKSLLDYLPSVDNTAELYLLNSFWYDLDDIKAQFKTRLTDLYSAETSFCEKQKMPSKINSWVREKTKGNITKILEENEHGPFAFINCLYFKGIWGNPFDKSMTAKADFKNYDGSVSKYDFITGEKHVKNVGGENFTAISLEFGNKAFSFDIFLPDEGFTTEDVMKSLKENGIPEFSYKEVLNIKIPKIALKNQIDLKPVLKSLGVKEIFGQHADFSAMTDQAGLTVAFAKQSNVVEIDEDGAKVVSSTAIGGGLTSPGPVLNSFVADRPFVFLVREQSTKAVLLAGRINKL
ncbi:MAG: serpin family protein [Muribaculaceae bacterium]